MALTHITLEKIQTVEGSHCAVQKNGFNAKLGPANKINVLEQQTKWPLLVVVDERREKEGKGGKEPIDGRHSVPPSVPSRGRGSF